MAFRGSGAPQVLGHIRWVWLNDEVVIVIKERFKDLTRELPHTGKQDRQRPVVPRARRWASMVLMRAHSFLTTMSWKATYDAESNQDVEVSVYLGLA